jgi:hypothetical protein
VKKRLTSIFLMILLLLQACIVWTVNGEQPINQAPVIKDGQSEQTGVAIPAAADNQTAAVPYTADVSQWFEDPDGDVLTYHIMNLPLTQVFFDSNTGELTYLPDSIQGNTMVYINVYAFDGKSYSTSYLVRKMQHF